jgi:hypothetical protein
MDNFLTSAAENAFVGVRKDCQAITLRKFKEEAILPQLSYSFIHGIYPNHTVSN